MSLNTTLSSRCRSLLVVSVSFFFHHPIIFCFSIFFQLSSIFVTLQQSLIRVPSRLLVICLSCFFLSPPEEEERPSDGGCHVCLLHSVICSLVKHHTLFVSKRFFRSLYKCNQRCARQEREERARRGIFFFKSLSLCCHLPSLSSSLTLLVSPAPSHFHSSQSAYTISFSLYLLPP